MVAVLNVVGVDWATFGNHEFDIGDASLRARLTESRFRVVSSNVTDASGALFPNKVRGAVVRVNTPAGIGEPRIPDGAESRGERRDGSPRRRMAVIDELKKRFPPAAPKAAN